VPLPLPADVMLKVIGMGDKDELAESDKVRLRALFCVEKTIFLLPFLEIGVASGKNPLLLREMQGLEDMK
jgi:hypothetical protein